MRKLEITGGPHGASIRPLLDGELLPVQRIELVFDVKDAIRARISEVVEARIDIEVEDVEAGPVTLHVVKPEIVDMAANVREVRYSFLIDGKGPDVASALRDAAGRLEGEPTERVLDEDRIYDALKRILEGKDGGEPYIDLDSSSHDTRISSLSRRITDNLP